MLVPIRCGLAASRVAGDRLRPKVQLVDVQQQPVARCQRKVKGVWSQVLHGKSAKCWCCIVHRFIQTQNDADLVQSADSTDGSLSEQYGTKPHPSARLLHQNAETFNQSAKTNAAQKLMLSCTGDVAWCSGIEVDDFSRYMKVFTPVRLASGERSAEASKKQVLLRSLNALGSGRRRVMNCLAPEQAARGSKLVLVFKCAGTEVGPALLKTAWHLERGLLARQRQQNAAVAAGNADKHKQQITIKGSCWCAKSSKCCCSESVL